MRSIRVIYKKTAAEKSKSGIFMKTSKIGIFILFACVTMNLFGSDHTSIKYAEMKHSLMTCYGLDELSTENILSKMINHFDDIDFQCAVNDFIEKSGNLNIQFQDKMTPATELVLNDAVLLAPQWHEILFESPFVRVLWTSSKPGDKEPFHIHQWKSLLFIIQGAEFEIENYDGTYENGFWPMGIYDLLPDIYPAAYKNLGPDDFKAIRFEIK